MEKYCREIEDHFEKDAVLYEKDAERGDPAALYKLGYIYDHGMNVPENPKRAFGMIKRSAEQGLPDAQLYLAEMYRFGRGCIKDNNQSYRWIMAAVKQNMGSAFFDAGDAYYYGWGVDVDFREALKWYQKYLEFNPLHINILKNKIRICKIRGIFNI